MPNPSELERSDCHCAAPGCQCDRMGLFALSGKVVGNQTFLQTTEYRGVKTFNNSTGSTPSLVLLF